MSLYGVVLVLKLVAAFIYVGGLLAAFLTSAQEERKRAVHAVASPAILATWTLGYVLASMTSLRFFELWLAGGLVLSLISQLALVYAVTRGLRDARSFAMAFVPIVLVIVLMVARPTWAEVF